MSPPTASSSRFRHTRPFRRRWSVIVLAILVAGSAAWVATEATSDEDPLPARASASYGATIVLWDPGAETIGPRNPITSPASLAHLVKRPNVAAIAAQIMYYQGSPEQLSFRVEATVDPATGFLAITGIGKDPGSAETIANAFSQGLIVYLSRLKTTQVNQQQRLLLEQVAALTQSGAKPMAIKTLRDRLAQLSVKRTTPVSLTEFERQPPIPRPIKAGAVVATTDSRLWVPESTRSRVLLACLLGLLLGIVLALLLERFDTRLRSSERAEEAFGLPVLAEVPAIPVGRREGVVSASHPYSRAGNAFRLVQLATTRWPRLDGGYANEDGSPRRSGATTILVTSPEARDGKTTVVANLAAAYAQTGDRVLVVSCDLRRPAIHEMFGVVEEPGLTGLLRSIDDGSDPASLDLTPYLKPCSILRVAVLPSGRTTDRPSELLGSAAMQRLGERLKNVTDVVILDCAPLVVAGDVLPLLPLADGVVLVARAGKTRHEVAASTATLLQRHGFAKAGVVLNDAREFSIPLAKRRMYRPPRKTRKAAKERPSTEVMQPWIPEPFVQEPMVHALVIPEFEDGVPEISAPVESTESPVTPEPTANAQGFVRVPDVMPSKGGRSPSAVDDLQRQLADIRARLEDLQLELPDQSGSEAREEGVTSGSSNETRSTMSSEGSPTISASSRSGRTP